MIRLHILALLTACLLAPLPASGEPVILQSTTSTQNSGLFDAILPIFEDETGIDVRVVAVGTGQALKNARNGDADVVMVHARTLEEEFVAQGWGIERHDLMYNDFVIVGPAGDPAGIAGLANATTAFSQIADAGALFASRGDSSGTHIKELALWGATGIDTTAASGGWYRETGAGMGTTLNIAVELQAYALTDRGTWLSFGNRRDHIVLVEGDARLFNQYGLILVNPARHNHVASDEGQSLIDWLLGPDGQAAIAAYWIDGQQLFFPNAAGGQ